MQIEISKSRQMLKGYVLFNTMRSYERHDVSIHGQFKCLFNSLLELIPKKGINDPFYGNQPVMGGLTSQRSISAERVSKSWRYDVGNNI